MTVTRGSRRGLWLPILIAAVALAITAFVVVALSAPAPATAPTSSVGATVAPTVAPTSPSASRPEPSATAAAADPATVACSADQGQMPPYLANDPCPSAILAVEAAVEFVGLPIDRLVIEPGPLYCNVIWEGLASPPICYGPFVFPGQYMHAYVSFVGSTTVAVVMLGIDLPIGDKGPDATRPPWHTTLVKLAVPPAGWVMP